jgi:hypothetical protein
VITPFVRYLARWIDSFIAASDHPRGTSLACAVAQAVRDYAHDRDPVAAGRAAGQRCAPPPEQRSF